MLPERWGKRNQEAGGGEWLEMRDEQAGRGVGGWPARWQWSRKGRATTEKPRSPGFDPLIIGCVNSDKLLLL